MKLKKEFIAYSSETDGVIVPMQDADFSGIVRGNKAFGIMIDRLSEGTTEQEIIEAVLKQYEGTYEDVQNAVKAALGRLGEIGALDE